MSVAEPCPDARSASAGVCFDAPTPRGPLRLLLEAPHTRRAVDAALALHRCEALLCALQAWMQQALEWRWIESPPTLPAHSHAHARFDATQASGVIELPWTLLRELPAPDAELAACLQWPAMPAVLAVSQFRVDAEELGLLEPGGAVVLPDSLRLPWQGLLRAACERAHDGIGIPVALPLPAAPRLAARGDRRALEGSDDDAARIACEVRLALPRALPADRLAGWFEGEPLADVGPHASLWCRGGANEPSQRAAIGRLMPWGDGWALAVEGLCGALAAVASAQ